MGDSESEDSARIKVDAFLIKCPTTLGDYDRYGKVKGKSIYGYFVPSDECRGCDRLVSIDEENRRLSCKLLRNKRPTNRKFYLESEIDFLIGQKAKAPEGVDPDDLWVVCLSYDKDTVFALHTGVDHYTRVRSCLECSSRYGPPDFNKGEIRCSERSERSSLTGGIGYIERRMRRTDELEFNTPDAIRFIKLTFPGWKVTARFDGPPFLKVEMRDMDEERRVSELEKSGISKESALKKVDEEARQRGETRF
jgi:hypothetical protein